MTSTTRARGRILHGSQVHVSTSPVDLSEKMRCGNAGKSIAVDTDPVSGDITRIHVRCGCGEVTVLECLYDGEVVVG